MRRLTPRFRILIAAAGIAVAAVLVVAAMAVRPAPSEPVAQADGPHTIGGGEGERVLVFGDSWTYGQAATDPEGGYAYLLAGFGGWRVTVAGEPGSGYLKPGWWDRTYVERIRQLEPSLAPDLIVVQGSINDRRLPADGYREAVTAAWDALAERFPGARIVVLGPAPHALPVDAGTARIDRDLMSLAAERGWPYVSPVGDEWITPENYTSVIDTSDAGKFHPSDAGHRYLAEKVAAAIRPLLEPLPVEAGTDQPEPAIG